jgi:hypothetical protein
VGALLGLAVGDAVGTTLEFKPRDTYELLRDMIGGGPFHLKPGEWANARCFYARFGYVRSLGDSQWRHPNSSLCHVVARRKLDPCECRSCRAEKYYPRWPIPPGSSLAAKPVASPSPGPRSFRQTCPPRRRNMRPH